MMKTELSLALLLGATATFADALSINPKGDLTQGVPTEITLTLDQPADSAKLDLRSYTRAFYLNGASSIALTPGADKKTFTAKVTPESFYHPVYTGCNTNGAGALELIPVVTRNGKTENLAPVKPWTGSMKIVGLQKANKVLTGFGKFGKAAGFDGKDAMAALNQMPFDAEKGTVEAWVFPPLMLSKQQGLVWFIQSADGSPWRYHQLAIPANTRKLEYITYNGQPQNPVGRIVSQEITGEDWIHVAAVYDSKAGKMELFVNGKSQGSAPYTVPCGGKKADLNIGARIHNAGSGYKFICPAQIMVDDLRVSGKVRPAGVPDKALTADGDTLVLLNFDGSDFMKK